MSEYVPPNEPRHKKALIMSNQTIESLEVLVSKPEEIYELLNEAEALLRQASMAQGSAGIRVTRHDPARYTFELTDTVPFGETWEQTAQ
jgi:hypothetical protein